MIGHQAPCQYFCMGMNVFPDLFQEEQVIFPVKEYLLAVIALVVDVVYMSFFELHGYFGLG
jgi:hypothetical protein